MASEVDRAEVQRLVAAGAQLVEVLSRGECADEHLPNAANVPLRELPARALQELDVTRPVIVYCHDYQ